MASTMDNKNGDDCTRLSNTLYTILKSQTYIILLNIIIYYLEQKLRVGNTHSYLNHILREKKIWKIFKNIYFYVHLFLMSTYFKKRITLVKFQDLLKA